MGINLWIILTTRKLEKIKMLQPSACPEKRSGQKFGSLDVFSFKQIKFNYVLFFFLMTTDKFLNLNNIYKWKNKQISTMYIIMIQNSYHQIFSWKVLLRKVFPKVSSKKKKSKETMVFDQLQKLDYLRSNYVCCWHSAIGIKTE